MITRAQTFRIFAATLALFHLAAMADQKRPAAVSAFKAVPLKFESLGTIQGTERWDWSAAHS